MFTRLVLFLAVGVGSTAGTAFAQLDVRLRLLLPIDNDAPREKRQRLEHFEVLITIVNGTSKVRASV